MGIITQWMLGRPLLLVVPYVMATAPTPVCHESANPRVDSEPYSNGISNFLVIVYYEYMNKVIHSTNGTKS